MRDPPEFGRPVQILHRSEEHRAQLEAENSLAQFDHALDLVEQWKGTLRLTPEVILESHRLATQNIYGFAGRFREEFVSVEPHTPPHWRKVPDLVVEMCAHANSICNEQDATLVAAYLMWRLNWIHPFYDGNGRVSRMISYLALCVVLNQTLPGTRTIPSAILDRYDDYKAALRAADRAWEHEGRIDVSSMRVLLNDLLIEQLASVSYPEET